MLVDGRGIPLSLIVTGANQHDVTVLDALIKAIEVDRPKPSPYYCQNLFADKGYDSDPARRQLRLMHYIPRIPRRQRGRWKTHTARTLKTPRRWVVERCHSWLNRFRKLLVRYEKKAISYVALVQLACAIIAWRKIGVIYG